MEMYVSIITTVINTVLIIEKGTKGAAVETGILYFVYGVLVKKYGEKVSNNINLAYKNIDEQTKSKNFGFDNNSTSKKGWSLNLE